VCFVSATALHPGYGLSESLIAEGRDAPQIDAKSLRPDGDGAVRTAEWREAPEYLALFAPRLHRDAYRTFVSPLSLDAVLEQLGTEGQKAESLIPFDAFGRSGRYDHWKLARLYGSRRVRVARTPHSDSGRVVESWTLASPYPDPQLERLEPGTLLIVLRVPPL
jgi:hypothetical protein